LLSGKYGNGIDDLRNTAKEAEGRGLSWFRWCCFVFVRGDNDLGVTFTGWVDFRVRM